MALSLNKIRLRLTLDRLTKLGFSLDHVELVPCPGGFFASMGPRVVDPIISDEMVTGFSSDPYVAFLKVISERIEGLAFRSGKAKSLPLCSTSRSDGFAAFPLTMRSRASAARQARIRALGEAVERFVWAFWWDDDRIGARISSADVLASRFPAARALLNGLETPYRVRTINALYPQVEGEFELVILVCEMENGGVLSGGACGPRGEEEETLTRAAAELFRHALASKRLVELRMSPNGFYQERLTYFALGPGGPSVRKRMESKGDEKVILSSLAMDAAVPHEYEDVICVYRCLFENQPPFIGGTLDRFCL